MPSTRGKPGFYAVNKGRQIGVFFTWPECEEQVKGYLGARFKKFGTMAEAEAFAFDTPARLPPPMVSSSLPLARKPTRLENIMAALASLPCQSQPVPSAVPFSPTPPVRPSSQKRFEEIYLALTTPRGSSPETNGPKDSTPPSTPSLRRSSTSPPTSPFRHPRINSSTPTTPESLRSINYSPVKPSLPEPRFSQDGPLSQFFSQFPSFTPQLETNAATAEFNRMCKSNYLEGRDIKKEQVHSKFKDALSQEFNTIYGTDVDCLESWQAICVRIGIVPVPDTLEDCRELVMNIHVNLVDLTTPKGEIKIFNSSAELSQYSKRTSKIFPSKSLCAGALLRYLLRHIFRPSLDEKKDKRGAEIREQRAREARAREASAKKGLQNSRGRRRFAPY